MKITPWPNVNSGAGYVTVVVAVSVELDCEVTIAVAEVEFLSVWACRFNVIVPGPVKSTVTGLFDPKQASPPKQVQLEIT